MCFSVEIDRNVQRAANRFKAEVSEKYFKEFESFREKTPKIYKTVGEDSRVFPNTHAPVLTIENAKRILRPMRYRIRPAGSREEIPSKYNMYNARLDSLGARPSWSTLLGRQHCLLPLLSFYEWVPKEQKKALINFRPIGNVWPCVPGLYDTWQSKDGTDIIHSFAIITTEPPQEVYEMGHDRCPIFLEEEYIDDWLSPDRSAVKDLLSLLNKQKKINLHFKWA